jgi:hypothetical protein
MLPRLPPPFVKHLLSASRCLSYQDRPALPPHFLGAASFQYFLIKRGVMIAFSLQEEEMTLNRSLSLHFGFILDCLGQLNLFTFPIYPTLSCHSNLVSFTISSVSQSRSGNFHQACLTVEPIRTKRFVSPRLAACFLL